MHFATIEKPVYDYVGRMEAPMDANLSTQDVDVLRRLAEQQAAISRLPVQREKAELWRRLNQLQPVRPMVWITEVPWNELEVDEELRLQTVHPWARLQEQDLRRLLYQWRHFPVDSIISDYLVCPLIIHSTGFGLTIDEDVRFTDRANEIVSHRYHQQIRQPADVDKIKDPILSYDRTATDENFHRMQEVYGDILPVRREGVRYYWFAPWDMLVEWWGAEQILVDLVDRPEMVQAAISRLVDAHIAQIPQWESLNLLTLNNDNVRVGSGGYGYTDELPGPDFDPSHPLAKNMWGMAAAQIFTDVSPKMHWEFALQHELRWLQHWGLTYYGCCDRLDSKVSLLRRIPNLRKISVSPWVDYIKLISAVGNSYVLSRKPSPAFLAYEDWQPEAVRQDLQAYLDASRGLSVELILKDISTVRYQPQRLREWNDIVMDIVEQYVV